MEFTSKIKDHEKFKTYDAFKEYLGSQAFDEEFLCNNCMSIAFRKWDMDHSKLH